MEGAGARALRGACGTGVYPGEKEVHVFRCIYHDQKATLDRPYSGKAGKKVHVYKEPMAALCQIHTAFESIWMCERQPKHFKICLVQNVTYNKPLFSSCINKNVRQGS